MQVPDELLVKLRSLDMFGLTIPKQYGGLDLMQTEILRLYEVLGNTALHLLLEKFSFVVLLLLSGFL